MMASVDLGACGVQCFDGNGLRYPTPPQLCHIRRRNRFNGAPFGIILFALVSLIHLLIILYFYSQKHSHCSSDTKQEEKSAYCH
jgi:hypothetical protein